MVKFFPKEFVFLVLVLFVIGLISAGFQVGNDGKDYSIDKIYGPEFNLTVWINISFTDEPLGSELKDNFGNSIILGKLLEINPSYDYICDYQGCKQDYSSSNGEAVKVVDLSPGSSELVGFVLTGNIISINNITFDVESDGSENSCVSPLKLDLLDDGIIESQSETLVNVLCSSEKDYGCFDVTRTDGVEEFNLDSGGTYCQKINLSESPGFRIGAWVKELSGSSNLTMSLYKENSLVASCTLPSITSEGEYFCDVNYVTSGGNHYACIFSGAGTGAYMIKGIDSAEKCGFKNKPIRVETSSYQIFAKSKEFGIPGTQNIINNLNDGRRLSIMADDYISKKYGTIGGLIQCSQGCVIPLNILSGLNQNVALKNLLIKYEKDSGFVTNNKFYDLTKVPAKVSSEFQKLYLNNAGFVLPKELGSYNLSLSLGGENIFSETIEIKNAPIINFLRPTKTASAFPTEFKVEVSSSLNVTKYEWNFGDNSSEITTKNKAIHTYSSIGTYDLKITVTNSKDIGSSKTFQIKVSSPKNLINTTLKTTKESIKNIRTQTSEFDLFTQQSISSILGLDFAESEVDKLELQFNAATSNEEYNLIITDLIKINLPKSILESDSTAVPITFFPDRENIELGVIGGITGETFDPKNEDGYINGVILWNHENLDTRIDFKEISGEFETSVEPLVRVFELNINEKKDIGYNYFLIMPKLDNLEFESGVSSREEAGFVYVDLSSVSNGRISFSTTEDVDFINLPAFVSPGFSKLSITEESVSELEEDSRPNLIVILAMIFLLIISFIVYIILQEWYKRKYESYLFKNKNDLYNMVNYVNNAKKKGMKKEDIEKNLKQAGWSSERIKYVVKKYAGKRTGMLEVPIDKLVGRFSNKNSK